MLSSSREITFHSALSNTCLTADDTVLHVIDHQCSFHKINLADLKIQKSTTLSKDYDDTLFDYYKRPFSVGQRLAYLPFKQKGAEYLIDIDKKIFPQQTLHYNDNEEVTKSALSENDTYLITGNERGRSYIISTTDGSLQGILPACGDAISAVAIKEEENIAARASFSKELVVYKLNSYSIVFEKKLDSIIEMMVFLDDRYLFAITRDGKLLKIDLYKQRIEKEVALEHPAWPSVMVMSHSKKYLYVGTRESVLFAVHIGTLDVVYQVKLPYQGITSLARSKNYFIVGFKTGELLFYNHREFESEFIQFIQLRQIKEASELFLKNIFLMTHRETKKIYEYWLEEKETIMNLLSRGEIEQAQKIAEPYLFHPQCKLEFNELEMLQPDLMSLHRFIRSLSFEAAYQLVALKPELKKSSLFAHMEGLWNKSLQKAQILLARDPVHNKESARDLLRLFLDVDEKKIIIENMIKRAGIFTLAESAVKEKNFAFYFKLVSQNTFLEFTPLYQKVLQVAERLQKEITKYLDENNYRQSLILADILHQFRPYQNQSTRLIEVSKALMILEHQLETTKLLDAVKTQDQYQLQSNYPLVQQLEQMKHEFEKEQYALLEAKEYLKVYNALAPYMSIAICKQNVANIMRKMYISQLEDAIQDTTIAVDWEKTFLNYFKFFPMDKLLLNFASKYEKTDSLQRLLVSQKAQESSSYPPTILSKQHVTSASKP